MQMRAKVGDEVRPERIHQAKDGTGAIPKPENRYFTKKQVKLFKDYVQPKYLKKGRASPKGWSIWKLITLMRSEEGATTHEIRDKAKIRSYKNRIRTLRLMGYVITRRETVFKEYLYRRGAFLVTSTYKIISEPEDGYKWDEPDE